MNINCIICSDIFQPSSEIYGTRCGHIFHYVCLIQWIERSKTCPQCRTKTTEKLINRIYLNIPSTEGIVEDMPTLLSKLDASKLQLLLKEKENKEIQTNLTAAQNELSCIEAEQINLKNELQQSNSALVSLKEQVLYFKDKAKHVDKVENELKQVKHKMRCLENLSKAITGTLEDVREVTRDCYDVKTLSSIVTALKKEITNLEKKKNNYFMQLKQCEKELNKSKKEITELTTKNESYRYNIKQCKQQIEQLSKLQNDPFISSSFQPTIHKPSSSSTRIQFESPAPLNENHGLKIQDQTVGSQISPNVFAKVKEIENSNSPYLQIKFSSIPVMHSTNRALANGQTSIFKTKRIAESTESSKMEYNGYGGLTKDCDDEYPKPKAVKRKHVTSSSKLKKLANPNKKTIDLFQELKSD